MTRPRRRAVTLAVAAALTLVACGEGGERQGSSSGACYALTPEGRLAAADVAFRGEAQPGETIDGVLVSPVVFRVTRYVKGEGPDEVRVHTEQAIGEPIQPRPGELWLIHGTWDAEDEVRIHTALLGGIQPRPPRCRDTG